MSISAESLIIGPHDPWDSLDPTTKRGLALVDADPLIAEYTDRWPTLMAKVVSLRGIVEVPNEELPIVYAAKLTVSRSILSADNDERTEEARFWLENSGFLVPFADDFSLIDVYRIERAIKESPFMGIAYEYLPLRDNLPRKQPESNDQIVQIRQSLYQVTNPVKPKEDFAPKPKNRSSSMNRRSVPAYTTDVSPNVNYL